MDGLKLGFMTSLLKSGYHKWMPYYILALAFSIASQTLELSPIVPQKKCVPLDILVGFLSTGTFIQDFRVRGNARIFTPAEYFQQKVEALSCSI